MNILGHFKSTFEKFMSPLRSGYITEAMGRKLIWALSIMHVSMPNQHPHWELELCNIQNVLQRRLLGNSQPWKIHVFRDQLTSSETFPRLKFQVCPRIPVTTA